MHSELEEKGEEESQEENRKRSDENRALALNLLTAGFTGLFWLGIGYYCWHNSQSARNNQDPYKNQERYVDNNKISPQSLLYLPNQQNHFSTRPSSS